MGKLGYVGEWPKADGSNDACLAYQEEDGNGYKVVLFPEPGGQYEIYHNIQEGDEPGTVRLHD